MSTSYSAKSYGTDDDLTIWVVHKGRVLATTNGLQFWGDEIAHPSGHDLPAMRRDGDGMVLAAHPQRGVTAGVLAVTWLAREYDGVIGAVDALGLATRDDDDIREMADALSGHWYGDSCDDYSWVCGPSMLDTLLRLGDAARQGPRVLELAPDAIAAEVGR